MILWNKVSNHLGGLARQAVADNYKEGTYPRCNNLSKSRMMSLYKERGQETTNNNPSLHELTNLRKTITGSYKGVTLKMAFWGINCIMDTQRKQYFVTILKDLTRIFEGRGYLKWTVRLEFPLPPLLFFFLKSNIQTFASFSREMCRVSWNWYSQGYVLLFVFSKSIITSERLQHDISRSRSLG